MQWHAFIFHACEEPVGRVNPDFVSQQTQLELLVEGLPDKEKFQDADHFFLDAREWNGLMHNTENEVTDILWASWPDEFFPQGGSIAFRWLPETVKNFTVYRAGASGMFDVQYLPAQIKRFDLGTNAFCGEVDLTRLPCTLEALLLGENELSGSLNFTSLPLSLRKVYLQENHFTGTIDLAFLTQAIEEISVASNSLHGCLDLASLPESMKVLILESNSFQGSLRICLPKNIEVITFRDNAIVGSVVIDGLTDEFFVVDGKGNLVESYVQDDGKEIQDNRFSL